MQRSLELGLVNRVATANEIDACVQEFVDAVLASSPLTVRLGKADIGSAGGTIQVSKGYPAKPPSGWQAD